MSKNSVKRDVRLQVAPGTLACTFEPDYNGCAAVVKGFCLTPAGLESPLAKRVKRGYVLVAIDDTVLTRMKHADVKRLLQRCVKSSFSFAIVIEHLWRQFFLRCVFVLVSIGVVAMRLGENLAVAGLRGEDFALMGRIDQREKRNCTRYPAAPPPPPPPPSARVRRLRL